MRVCARDELFYTDAEQEVQWHDLVGQFLVRESREGLGKG